jgi:AcrR family transcriptional regulator
MTKSTATPPAAAKRTRRRASRGSGEQLRAEIVAATKDLLAESANSEAVSIRAVADAVGVTSPSIYLHFADKDALIEAVVADVFAELDATMVAAGEAHEAPLDRLCAFGMAYVQFAIEHPEHYRIATMELHGPYERPEASALDHILADAAFTHFMDTVSACMESGIFAPGDPVPLTLELWSAAHGIASLMIAKPFLPWGDKLETANNVLRAAALGRAVNDLHGSNMTPADVDRWLAAERKKR